MYVFALSCDGKLPKTATAPLLAVPLTTATPLLFSLTLSLFVKMVAMESNVRC